MIRDLGYGESKESRSMFSEGLATSERILGTTNAPRLMSPMRAYSDVISAHAVESRKRDDSVREVDKRFRYTLFLELYRWTDIFYKYPYVISLTK